MAKKQSAGESSAEAAKKRRLQKQTAPKAGAKKPAKPPAKPAKPPAKPAKPVAKPARKARPAPAQAEPPRVEVVDDDDDLVEAVEQPAVERAALSASAEARADADEEADDEAEQADDEAEEADDEAVADAAAVEVAPATLSPEEQELSALYGEELAKPAVAHTEYADRQTADEDRPMVPEINARDERKHHWQDRRDQRRQRRDERDRNRQGRRDERQARGQDVRPQEPRPEQRAEQRSEARPEQRSDQRGGPPFTSQGSRPALPPPPPAAPPVTNGHAAEHDALARVGTPLGDAAATVFAQLRNGQPLPVRQLAQMMRKRNLVEIDPEQGWPQLKAELLGDERSYRTLGLRPRIVYRGRDLFAPGPVAMSQTADAEANVAAALSRLAGATHRALAGRIAKATGVGFERLIHAYLVAAGYREIEWVKRVGGIAYASAIAPGIDRTVLISARSGDQPIDRRGIGELRVGVEAKNLVAGILFSARELSEDAERELERAGRSIAVMCGDQLVAALIATGVGVVSSAAPLRYVDDQLLDELLAG